MSVLERYSAAGRVSVILCLLGLFNNANSEIMLNDRELGTEKMWKEAVVP
jgi:hypothetical protein